MFRITPEQLKAADGKVRCCQCNKVFNALHNLMESPTSFVNDSEMQERLAEIDHNELATTTSQPPNEKTTSIGLVIESNLVSDSEVEKSLDALADEAPPIHNLDEESILEADQDSSDFDSQNQVILEQDDGLETEPDYFAAGTESQMSELLDQDSASLLLGEIDGDEQLAEVISLDKQDQESQVKTETIISNEETATEDESFISSEEPLPSEESTTSSDESFPEDLSFSPEEEARPEDLPFTHEEEALPEGLSPTPEEEALPEDLPPSPEEEALPEDLPPTPKEEARPEDLPPPFKEEARPEDLPLPPEEETLPEEAWLPLAEERLDEDASIITDEDLKQEPALEQESAPELIPQEYATADESFQPQEPLDEETRFTFEEEYEKPQSSRFRPFWAVASLLLLLPLSGQLSWYLRDSLITHYTGRQILQGICGLTGCEVPIRRDTEQIIISNRALTAHPEKEGVLSLKLEMVNTAAFQQPFPKLQLSLYNDLGKTIARRTFLPNEYRARQYQSNQMMPKLKAVHVELELQDPGNEVTGFKFDFL
jgi:predicted Zn finger-like uncharacterized protein